MLIFSDRRSGFGQVRSTRNGWCEKAQSRLYLATMQPFGKSAEARIARHRALVRERGSLR